MFHFSGIIALIILFTALLWFAVGWWFSSIERAKQQGNRETEWNHHLNTLRRDRDSFRDQVEIAHGKIRVLENRRADGQSPPRPTENEAATKAMIARMQSHLDQAKQQINGFAQKVKELSEQSVEREDVLEQLKKKLTDTSRTLHDRDQKLTLLSARSQPESQTSSKDTAEHEHVVQKLRIELQTQADAAEQDRQRLDHTIGEHMQTIGALHKELSQRENQRAGADKDQQEFDELKAQLDELKEENHGQFEKIEQLSQGSKVVEHQRTRLKTLQADYDEQQKTVAELERVVANSEPQANVAEELKDQLEQLHNANHKLSQSQTSLEEQLDASRQELAEIREKTEHEQSTNHELSQSHASLEEQLNASRQELAAIREKAEHDQHANLKHAQSHASLEEQLDASRRELAAIREKVEHDKSTNHELSQSHESLEEQLDASRRELTAIREKAEHDQRANLKLSQSHASLEEQYDASRQELAVMRKEVEQKNNAVPDQNQALQETLQEHKQTIAMLEQKANDQSAELNDELHQMREAMQSQEQIVAQLRDVLSKPATPARIDPRPSPPANRSVTRLAAPQSGDLFASIEPPSSTVSLSPTVKLYDQAPESRDDLKKITGIGPAFERALNGLGLYRFEQIAALNDSDIEWVAQELRSFPDRILNGHWIEQAQNLLSKRD